MAIDLEKLVISNHAKERYAERIMNREDKCGVQQFVSLHEEKIVKDLTKMIEHGDLIYAGKSLKEKNRNCEVYLCGLWILIVDSDNCVVVTLFRVDLGVGDEFDKQYVANIIELLEQKKAELKIFSEEAQSTIRATNAEINMNQSTIDELKRQIKRLEETNAFNNELIKEQRARIADKEYEVRHVVELLTSNKIF